jgi:hypothetical protein
LRRPPGCRRRDRVEVVDHVLSAAATCGSGRRCLVPSTAGP